MIDTEEKLNDFLSHIQGAPWIAVDTEADSLHAYPEKLCLLQISVPGHDRLIDPLAGLDFAQLLKSLKDRELIFHGADYDLRLLFRSFRFVPKAIFDTMIAARLLGYTEFGLTNLVARRLGVQLEKGPQKMNWAQRPLSERMEAYARNDTRYLYPLAELLSRELEEKGRLPWLQETCARLIMECAQERPEDPDQVWRIKGSDRLDRTALAVLREIWQWREREAIDSNKPPYFVLSHETVVAIAKEAASGRPIAELAPMSLSAKRQARLIAALERGLQVPARSLPKLRRSVGTRLTHIEQARFDRIRAFRDERAKELGIDPTLIASRSMLVACAQNWEQCQFRLMNWQREILEPALVRESASQLSVGSS